MGMTIFSNSSFSLDAVKCLEHQTQKISSLVFDGLKTTKPFVVERELLHKLGQKFACDNWLTEKKKLESLDIFASVDLQIKDSQDAVKLVYIFDELPPFLPFVGGKKTDQDGLILGPAIASFNLAGRDIRVEGYGRTTVPDFGDAIEYQLVASSYWMGLLPVEYWLQFVYTDSYNPFGNFPEKSQFYLAEFKQRLGRNWSLKYRGEFFTIATDSTHAADVLIGPTGVRDLVPRASFGLVRDTRVTRNNPHRGIYSELLYIQSAEFLGGDVNFGEILGDFYFYFPLRKNLILHYSFLGQYRFVGRVGAYDRFYVGGANTLRGYDPVIDGFSGTSEILSFIEFRHEFFDKRPFKVFGQSWNYGLQVVLGYDVAYVWEGNHLYSGTDGKSIYTGLHVLMPGLNRIRLELGNKAMKFELDWVFTLGLFERTSVQRWRIR